MTMPIDSFRDDGSGQMEIYRPDLRLYEDIYRRIHRNPEISTLEAETAGLVAGHLEYLGFDVVDNIGGHGLVGILRNGKGRTILLRSELDALPLREETGLPYASKKQMNNRDGKLVPVMHACGHDMHMAALLGASEFLYAARSQWSGTLLVLFQPAEETVGGAQSMIDDGLWERVPKPDLLLAQHMANLRAGSVGYTFGAFTSARDAFEVRIFGKGGHASAPELCIDPVVIAAYIIVRLQSIVSREIGPGGAAVVTCGSIRAGDAANIIPEYADLKLDVRTYDPEIRKTALQAIKRIINAECQASGVAKEPLITQIDSTPACVNDKEVTNIASIAFRERFGDENVREIAKGMGSEDFGVLGESIGAPYTMWATGTVDPHRWDEAEKNGTLGDIPWAHSSKFAPAIEPTLKTAVDALAVAASKLFEQ